MEDDENILLANNNANAVQGRSKIWRTTIEPALMVLFFGYNLADPIIPNMLLEQTCLNFGYNKSDCSNLISGNTTKQIEEHIQPRVAEILMTNSLLTSIIPAVLSLFLGPWTDKFGRKKVIAATFFGFGFTLLSFSALAYASTRLPMIDPRLYVLAYIPMIITGGWPSMIAAVLCYVTDISKPEARSYRLTIIEMIVFIGVLFGTASSSYVLKYTSPSTVFLIGTVCALLAAFHVVFIVEESVKLDHNVSACGQIKELVSYAPVVDMLKTCFKRRPFRERRMLWCLIIILMFSIFCLDGTSTVFYLFVREKFNWTLKEATLYTSANLIILISGSLLGLTVLKSWLKFSDLSLAVLANVCVFVEALMKTVAQNGIQMYASSALCMFKILSSPMCRSLIAAIIPNTEIGKVYSVTSAFEAVSSLIAAPLYTYIYEKTFTFFASAFFLITAVAYLINIILIYCVGRMKRTRDELINPYMTINNDSS